MFFKSFFIIFLFCLPLAFAAYTENSVDNWFYANQTIKLASGNITLQGSTAQDSLGMTYNDRTMLVANGTCEETAKFFFCIDDMREGSFDYYWRVYRMQYHILVKEKLPKLDFKRTFSLAEMFPGQFSKVDLQVTNSGSFAASGLHFEDSFPGFVVADVVGCKHSDTAVVLDTTLQPDQSFSCKYTLKAVSKSDLHSKAQASYDNGIARVTVYSDEAHLLVYGDELSFSLAKNLSLEVGEAKTIRIIVNNTLSSDIYVPSLLMTVPYGLSVSKYNFWSKINDYKFEFQGSIPQSSSRALELTFSGERMKTYFVPFVLQYDVAGMRKIFSQNLTVVVSSLNLTIDLKVPKFVNDSMPIDISVYNPSVIQTFSSVDAKVLVPCLNFSYAKFFADIPPRQQKVLISDVFKARNIASVCFVTATITYETSFGQHIKKSITSNFSAEKITAIPVKQPAPVANNPSSPSQASAPKEETIRQSKLSLNKWWFIIPAAIVIIFVLFAFIMRKKKLVSKEEVAIVTKELKPPETEKVVEKQVEKEAPAITEAKPVKQKKFREPKRKKESSYRF